MIGRLPGGGGIRTAGSSAILENAHDLHLGKGRLFRDGVDVFSVPLAQTGVGEGEYVADFQAVFRRQFRADEDFVLILWLDMAASKQRIFLIQKHIRKPGIPHSGYPAHVAGLAVTGARQEVKLIAFGIAIMLRIEGLYLPLGSVDYLGNALLGNHRGCSFTERAIHQSHLRIGPDVKGRADVGTQIPGCLSGPIQNGKADQQKGRCQKEDQEKKHGFSFLAGQVKSGPPANAHKKTPSFRLMCFHHTKGRLVFSLRPDLILILFWKDSG